MKKLKVLGLAAIAAGMFSLTSCLDGGGNTQQLSSYAIVDYSSTMRTLIYPLGYFRCMSLQLQMIRLIGLEIVCWLILRSILIRRIMRMPVQMVFMWRQELLLLH